jgi:solute:Na+ symporter, SSS family
MHVVYVAVLAAVVLVLLAVSLRQMRGVKTEADFLVAGRHLPLPVLVFTLLSSWIGSGSLLGSAENAYNNGLVALWQPAGGWIGLLFIYFLAPRVRRFAQFTIPDLLEARYNQAARVLGALAIVCAFTAITSYQFIGGGDILALVFPGQVSPYAGRVIIAAFVICFTALAGMSSVAYMDVAIGLLASTALLVSLPLLVAHLGGPAGLHSSLPAGYWGPLNHYTPISALELFLPNFLLLLGNQSVYQKFFSAKSERAARSATVCWIFGTIILESVIVLLAMSGRAMDLRTGGRSSPREILAWTALHYLPPGLGAVLMGAIFAKIISTANNYLFSPATNIVHDVFVRYLAPRAQPRTVILVSRLVVVLLGAWSLYQGLHTGSVLKATLYAYTIYSAALTPVVLAAFFSKRATGAGAVAAIAAGTAVTLSWGSAALQRHLPAWLAQRDAIFPALAAAVLALVFVSLLTPRPSAAVLAKFHSPA